jgi:hypothetical protein
MVLGVSHLLCTMDTHNVHMPITQQTSLSDHGWYLYACGIGKQLTVLMPWVLDAWQWDVQKDPVDHIGSMVLSISMSVGTMCGTHMPISWPCTKQFKSAPHYGYAGRGHVTSLRKLRRAHGKQYSAHIMVQTSPWVFHGDWQGHIGYLQHRAWVFAIGPWH